MSKIKTPQKSHSLIKGIRSLQRISQTALADKLGCSQSKISKVEAGVLSLDKGDASRIAEALGVTTQTLFPNIEGPDD